MALSGGIPAGSAYVDVVPNMAGFAQKTSAGVQSAGAGITSNLKKTLAPLGVALGATFAIGFGKSAISAFEEAQKSLDTFSKSLENTGQQATINADSFNSWLGDFALNIGKDDDAIRDLSTKLVNAFDFSSLGGDATANLEKTTQAIEDMSAATGLAESRLVKLFQAILNDPGAAVTQLQKLGAITEEQADHFKDMADNGKDAQVTMELLDVVSKKYAGTAEDTATESEKMSAAWGEFKETIGGVLLTILRPIVTLLTALFRALEGKPALILAVAGAITTLVVAMNVSKISSFFSSMKAGMTSLGGSLAGGIGVIGGVTAAIGLLSYGMQVNAENAAKNKAAIDSWVQALSDGSKTMEQFQAAMADAEAEAPDFAKAQLEANAATILHDAALARINQRLQEGTIKLDYYRQRAKELGQSEATTKANIDAANTAIAAQGKAADKTKEKMSGFAHLTAAAFKEWKDSVKESIRGSITGLSGFDKKWALTGKSLERTAKQMAAKAKQIAKAYQALNKDGVPDEFKKWLIDQGPDAVHAFEDATKKGKDSIVESWKTVEKQTDKTEGAINKLKGTAEGVAGSQQQMAGEVRGAAGEFNNAAAQADAYRSKLVSLDGLNVHTTITTETVKGTRAGGGPVTGGETYLVGENGPELFKPLTSGSIVPNNKLHAVQRRGGGGGPTTLRILDWRNGIAELDGELDWTNR